MTEENQKQQQTQDENQIQDENAQGYKQAELENIQSMAGEKLENTSIEKVELSESEESEVDETFKNVQDFRSLGEKITSPINDVIDKTTTIIEGDPVMQVSDELKKVNNDVQSVYKDIVDDDSSVMKFLKGIPVVGNAVTKVDNKFEDMSFDMKGIKGQIETIFSGFDQSYESLNKSIDMQKEFLDGLENNLGKVKSYREYVSSRLEEFKGKLEEDNDEKTQEKYKMFIQNVEYFLRNLDTLIGNLELARKRLLMRLDSAVKLSLSMNGSRPIFQTLLSVAIIESSGQKALDASMESMEAMGNTIDNMSKELTNDAVESSKKAEEMTQKSVLDVQTFVDNVEKLKNHFETIESYREEVSSEAQKEREAFDKAASDLKEMKDVDKADYDELQQVLNKDSENSEEKS